MAKFLRRADLGAATRAEIALEGDTFRIIGVDVPHVTIGVTPGRDLASMVELSAREFRMRRLGSHAGKDLNDKLIQSLVQHNEP